MPEQRASDVARALVSKYERGVMTLSEFVVLIVEAADQNDPAEMAEVIPEELLNAVRKAIESPPSEESDVSPGWWSAELPADEV